MMVLTSMNLRNNKANRVSDISETLLALLFSKEAPLCYRQMINQGIALVDRLEYE